MLFDLHPNDWIGLSIISQQNEGKDKNHNMKTPVLYRWVCLIVESHFFDLQPLSTDLRDVLTTHGATAIFPPGSEVSCVGVHQVFGISEISHIKYISLDESLHLPPKLVVYSKSTSKVSLFWEDCPSIATLWGEVSDEGHCKPAIEKGNCATRQGGKSLPGLYCEICFNKHQRHILMSLFFTLSWNSLYSKNMSYSWA